eukprot:CAMPEP_0113467720 /NCGR_PEP_ID=MMETSP0014_2-20120614/14967_1 /TAXON_ID=2857 /ORGANISM="Nitzschia sp." /LENGTH=635 /DNA_ID=CAMNT_0000360051 /DNA_START=102 /DNA_END=2009 /DNA_ORIENTATION=+ /assembly_acc=CAM_ASM_000159
MSTTKSTKTMIRWTTATLLLVHSVSANNNNNNNNNGHKWLNPIRRLQADEFMTNCQRIFMSPGRMLRNEYLASKFAEEVGEMCESFNLASDCPPPQFQMLPIELQNGFFNTACSHLGYGVNRPDCPVQSLSMIGDTGYVYSANTVAEIDEMRVNMCAQIGSALGNYVIGNVSKENPSGSDGFDNLDGPRPLPDALAPTESPQKAETAAPTNKVQMDLNDKDLFQPIDQVTGGDSGSTNTVSETEALSVGAIIGIAVGVAVLLFIFFYYERRRHSALTRQIAAMEAASDAGSSSGGGKDQSTVSSPGFKSLPPPANSSVSSKRKLSSNRLGIKPATPMDEIQIAIDNTDWDNVYRLASKLAETDDVCTLPDFDETRQRTHLNDEDQERTRTLDELMSRGDWTGLAVTAALYAGESGSTSPPTKSKSKLKSGKRKSRTVPPTEAFDHNLAVVPSSKAMMSDVPIQLSEVDLEKGETSSDMDTAVKNLEDALKAGDWTKVGIYANLIKDQKGSSSSSSFASSDINSKALVVATKSSPPSSPRSKISFSPSFESTDSDMSRKMTIEKLIKANKWKGVSIMANLYEMESKSTKSVVKSKQHSPRGSRTTALRHNDRLGEDDSNLVDFRRESDDKPEVPYL